MKLLFITKDDCPYCIEKREMVYQQLPELFEDLFIQEYNISHEAELVKPYYAEGHTPAFVFLTDEDKPMFTITGVPTIRYIEKMIEDYQGSVDGVLNDDDLELVVGGIMQASVIHCRTDTTCVKN